MYDLFPACGSPENICMPGRALTFQAALLFTLAQGLEGGESARKGQLLLIDDDECEGKENSK